MSHDSTGSFGSDTLSHRFLCEEKLAECFAAADLKTRDIRSTSAPTVTRYYVQLVEPLPEGVLLPLTDTIRVALDSRVRVVEADGNPCVVYVEVENVRRYPVRLAALRHLMRTSLRETMPSLCLGIDADGRPLTTHLGHLPHLLVAGAAGSGKTSFFHLVIEELSTAVKPHLVNFVLIAPKPRAFANFSALSHLLCPVVRDPAEATAVLCSLLDEMKARLSILDSEKAFHIYDYNKRALRRKLFPPMPYTVVIIDELFPLMLTEAQRETNTRLLCDLLRTGHAVGIHLLIGVQSISPIILPPDLLAAIPSRLALRLPTPIDSLFVLNSPGADCLRDGGDALFRSQYDEEPIRFQIAQVD